MAHLLRLASAGSRLALHTTLTGTCTRRALSTSLDAITRPRSTFWSGLSARHFPIGLPSARLQTVSFSSNHVLSATHRDSRRKFIDIPLEGERQRYIYRGNPRNLVFWAILAGNVVVFGMWKYAESKGSEGDYKPLMHMHKYWTTSWQNIKDGRWITLLTSCMSHQDTSHILVNGFTYWFMAPAVMTLLGPGRFLALYGAGGLFCSLVSLAWKRRQGDMSGWMVGASGAIYAINAYFACVYPRVSFLIFGIVPCPAWLFVASISGYSAWGMVYDQHSRTGHAGHLGGLMTGMAYFLLRR